ncbi:MAG: hypothetical protein Q8P24_18755 [Desulfobacterales bacterium]|nr:hypothetical protein [Desulfobacterales bacterium]
MAKAVRQTLICLLVLGLVLVPFGPGRARAEGPLTPDEIGVEQMMADLALVRPLGMVATALGFVCFTLALPFSALGGNTEATFLKLVKEPAKFTFIRPLGDF